MERTLERAPLAGRLGGLPVPAQVAVPLAVLGIGEIPLAVVQGLFEPIQVLLLPGVPVEHHGGDEDLVVGPPQLHVVLIGLRGLAQAVGEVEQSAVLLVPAGLNGPVEHLGRLVHQLLVPGALGVLQQEPHALDVVARVHNAAFGVVQPGLPVGAHVLQLGLHVVLKYVVHALLGPLLIEGLSLRVHPQQGAGDIEEDHGDAEGPPGAGLGDGLGADARGVRHAVVQIPVQVVGPAGPLQVLLPPGHTVVLRVGQGVKRLGEAVPPLAQGLSVLGNGEVQPPPRPVVDTVLLQEVQAALTGGQPLVLGSVEVAQVGEDPAAPPLHPHTLVGGEHLSLPVQAGVHPAVHRVHAVVQPKRHAAVQLLLEPLVMALYALHIHKCVPPFLRELD